MRVAPGERGGAAMNRVSDRIKRTARMLYMNVRETDRQVPPVGGGLRDDASVPLVIATMLRGDGITGVETHIRQLRRYLEECGAASTLVTPFSWSRPLTYPVFGLRPLVLERGHRRSNTPNQIEGKECERSGSP